MLLEREDALAQLGAALDRVRSHRRGELAVVVGEAGAGKTTVVRRFAEDRAADVDALWGLCDSLRTPRPLGPLADIAPHLLAEGATRDEIFAATLDQLSQPTTRPPLVVIEDVHWADDATLDLLTMVGRRVAQTKALIVLTYRDDEVGGGHPLRFLLGDLAGTISCRVHVAPLSAASVAVLAAAAGHDIDAISLHQHTGGNPFFVSETLAAGDTELPTTVRHAVLARAGRLSPDARQVLDAAAIVPGGVEAWLLDALISHPADRALDECVDRGMLVPAGEGLAFRHEIARLAVDGALTPGQKRTLHRNALQQLQRIPGGRGIEARLAFHAAEAGAGDEVAVWAPIAASQAVAAGAHREAAAHLESALRYADDLPVERRLELWEARATECLALEQLDEALTAFDYATQLARQMGDRAEEGDLLARSVGPYGFLGQPRQAAAALDAALAVLEPRGDTAELAHAFGVRSSHHMLAREFTEAEAWGQRALALCNTVGRREDLCFVLIQSGIALLMSGEDAGLDRIHQGIDIARTEGWDHRVALGLSQIGSGAGEIRRYDLALPALRQCVEFCETREQFAQRNYAQSWLARCHLEQARWDEAGAIATGLLRSPRCTGITRITALTALGKLRARRGDPGVWPLLDEALELARENGHLQRLWPAAAARAEAAWLDGGIEREDDTVAEAYAMAVGLDYPWAVDELAFWRWRAGQPDQPDAAAATPFATHRAGHPEEAATAWDALGCPYEAALARVDSDDPEEVTAGVSVLRELGARPAAHRAATRLRALGAQVPRGPSTATRTNTWGLTPRQAEVAALLVERLTNAEIAERLVPSLFERFWLPTNQKRSKSSWTGRRSPTAWTSPSTTPAPRCAATS